MSIAAFSLASFCLGAAVMPQSPSPGIDRELARQRAATLRDVEYDLRFTFDDRNREVSGTVSIRWQFREDGDREPLVLDFDGASIGDVLVNNRDAQLERRANHLIVPADLLGDGINGIRATFTSKVAPTGTPLTVYRDQADGRDYYYTLLVPADAHRLFPCFDQPDLRARFRLELDVPAAWTAVANTAPIDPTDPEPEVAPNGKLLRFAQSKPLPTYLFAFACGPFAEINAPHPRVPGVTSDAPMRILLRGSRREDLDLDAIVRLHHDGLAWLARSFDVPYPFDKLDLVLLPGFPYGGMEHAGAIFYRESALVFDHEPTVDEQVRRSTLVYHELSHQWFGNLVTMKWFDDLWLKEGFATFYGYRAMAALEPEQRAWLRFLQRVKPQAYAVDATPGTTPVFQELENLADAKSAYGAIVYNKAPAVLRALFAQLGAEVFQTGVKRFLEQHAYGSATWQDLAAALEGAARRDLGRWSERWLLAPSMPQVRVRWSQDEAGVVTAANVTQRALGGDGTWPIDLELLVIARDGARETLTVATDAASTGIPALVGRPAPAAILANPQDVAYGQFVPDPTTVQWLLAQLANEPDPLVRACGTTALYEAVREAELDPARFVDTLLAMLAAERDADSHRWLLSRLGTCLSRYLPDERAAPLRGRAVALLLEQLTDGEASGRELSTFRFLAWASDDPRVLDICRLVVRGEAAITGLAPGRRDRFLAAAALLAAGKQQDDYQRLREEFADEDVGKEVFVTEAAIPTSENKARYWQHYQQLDDPPEQWTQDSLDHFHWPGQQQLTLPYLERALRRVDWVKRNRRIFFMPAWLDAFVNGHSSPEALAVVDAFLAEQQLSDDVRRKLLQSRDGLARAVRIREAFAPKPR
ncbi:MAG: ERAP1-like C-terminal domain-containing protein [Planctomycetes bacterium]|nr:ERAP1-like C-terminal domain-containing protein [Planctomycetota bacterium]